MGTGELARYIGRYGTERLRSCVFIESLAPSFVKSGAGPMGSRPSGRGRRALAPSSTTGPAWLSALLKGLHEPDSLPRRSGSAKTRCGPRGTPAWRRRRGRRGPACRQWLDDYKDDIKRIDIPTLIIHGNADRILAIDGQGRLLHDALPDSEFVEIDGGPHLVCVTHAREVNQALLGFLGSTSNHDPAGPVER